jgi:hypothetical protein
MRKQRRLAFAEVNNSRTLSNYLSPNNAALVLVVPWLRFLAFLLLPILVLRLALLSSVAFVLEAIIHLISINERIWVIRSRF